MRRFWKLGPILMVGMLIFTSACTQNYATTTSDTLKCVFDGSERGGQKLKFQIQPGAESKAIDDNDQQVDIPSSNRFFMAALDDNSRDPLAPKFYEAPAAHNIFVQIQGQVRFRFNLTNACEWYSKHGRRNLAGQSNLGFNTRGQDAFNAGWFHFLTENFGQTMQQVASEQTGQYDAFALSFHYPENANPDTGDVAAGTTPGPDLNLKYADNLGRVFTDRLNANLGGQYFCGIDPDPNNAANACPPMKFQVIAIHTSDPSLEAGRQDVEKTRQALRNAQLKGDLEKKQADALAASAAAHQALLDQQVSEARKQAEIKDAECLARADRGLDCQGNRPAQYYNGQPTK